MAATRYPNNRVSLLYVEDDPVTRGIMEKIIRMKLPEVDLLIAENGCQGLELYREHAPALVITDVAMPLMDGIVMATEIKAENPKAIIIVLSAYSNTEYLLNSIEIGINHYVLKPIDFTKFFATIEKCLAAIEH